VSVLDGEGTIVAGGRVDIAAGAASVEFGAGIGERDPSTLSVVLSAVGDDDVAIGTGTAGLADLDVSSPPAPSALDAVGAREVAYLYEAAFGREGDAEGVSYWIEEREGGLSRTELARLFLASPEFEARFGEALDPADPAYLDDDAFVGVLYGNVLDRAPDGEGFDFWLDALAEPEVGREDVLLAFATSPENVAGSPGVETLAEVSDGVWDFTG
jgi:hypothetical protein